MSKPRRPTCKWINYPIYWSTADIVLAEAIADHPMQQFRNFALTGYEQQQQYMAKRGRNSRR